MDPVLYVIASRFCIANMQCRGPVSSNKGYTSWQPGLHISEYLDLVTVQQELFVGFKFL